MALQKPWAVEAFAPIAEQLAEFVGGYFLDPAYTIGVESGKLSVVNREERKRPLDPTLETASRSFQARGLNSSATRKGASRGLLCMPGGFAM